MTVSDLHYFLKSYRGFSMKHWMPVIILICRIICVDLPLTATIQYFRHKLASNCSHQWCVCLCACVCLLLVKPLLTELHSPVSSSFSFPFSLLLFHSPACLLKVHIPFTKQSTETHKLWHRSALRISTLQKSWSEDKSTFYFWTALLVLNILM